MASNLDELKRLIQKADLFYFEKDQPIMTDEEYDPLKQELAKKEPQSDLVNQIGSGTPGSYKHDKPMLSLDKAYTEDDVKKWSQKIKGMIVGSLKLDGLALSLKYQKGELKIAVTRGDGEFGEDVTDTVSAVTHIPKRIPVSKPVEIRGEAFLPFSSFEWIAKNITTRFENPRNLVSGQIKTKRITGDRRDFSDRTKKILSLVKFVAYEILAENRQVDSYSDTLNNLKKIGFAVPEPLVLGLSPTFDIWKELDQNREKYDMPVDGVVLRADSYKEFEEQGCTGHHPRAAIAYKFSAEVKETKLIGIEWSLGRTGKITPVGIVEPVRFPGSGVTVSRVSLHNLSRIKELGLSIGATVLIQRSGDVIPHIVQAISAGHISIVPPSCCPSCGKTTSIQGDFLVCVGASCKGSILRSIEHYCKTVGIDGFGPAIAESLYDAGLVKNFADLYRLTVNSMTPVLGEKTSANLMKQIDSNKNIPLEKFLAGLGIPNLGNTMGKKLEKICSYTQPADLLGLPDLIRSKGIEGMGDVIRQNILEGIPKFKDQLLSLTGIVTLVQEQSKSGVLSGKSFVFTGTLNKMTRSEAQKRVVSLGGECPSGVKSDLSYLIIGEGEEKSSKQIKAEKLGITIISENDFLKLIGE